MSADPVAMASELCRRMSNIKQSRCQLSDELSRIEATLNESMSAIDVVNQRLKDIKLNPPAQQAKSVPALGMSPDDFKMLIEKTLQGSLDAAGDKLSDRIMKMIGELKGLAGTEREFKIRQIQEAADSDKVDLSGLFISEEVQSNLGEVGVEEKESKGIESSLEKLKKMREKPDSGGTPENKGDKI